MTDLRNFDDVPTPTSAPAVNIETPAQIVTSITTTPLDPVPSKTHLLADPEDWEWRQLRDYVIGEIEQRFGVQPRMRATNEAAIFKSFIKRYPDGLAIQIARHAFDVLDGWWSGAPISITRFCIASDPFFATPIKDKLLLDPR
jgi:hypothetical protein